MMIKLSKHPVRPNFAYYLAGLVFLSVSLYAFNMERIKPEALRDMIVSAGYWGPVIYIFGNAIRPFLLFPAVVLGIAGGLAFGPLLGTVYLVIGTALGAALCFCAARLIGNDLLGSSKWLKSVELDSKIAANGFKTVLMLRLAPIMPWDIVSIMAGLSKVRFWPYFWATVIGSIPGAIVFCYLGDVLPIIFEDVFLTVAGVIAAAAIYYFHNKLCHNHPR